MSITDRAKDRAKKNPTLLMVLLLIAHGLYISTNRSQTDPGYRLFQVGFLTFTSPFQMGFSYIATGLKNGYQNYFSLKDARAENKGLIAERTQLQGQILEQNEKLKAFEQLNALKDWQKTSNYDIIPARVISRDPNRMFNTILIDKGSMSSDIQKDQPVVTPEGLVGRVITVQPFTSQVLLITDERSGAGVESQAIAQTVEKRSLGVLKGRGKNEFFCDLRIISTTEKVKNGEQVITSGLDGIYPKGLLIGKVRDASRHPLEVELAAPLASLETVAVLKVSPDEIKKASRELAGLIDAERTDVKKNKTQKKP